MKTNVIVIFYDGARLADEAIINALARACDSNKELEVFHLDSKEVAKTLVGATKTIVVEDECANEMTAEENAVVYVGTILKEALETDDKISIMMETVDEIAKAQKKPNDKKNKQFMNALFTLAQGDLSNISPSILREYDMDWEKISIIKSCYNHIMSQRHG